VIPHAYSNALGEPALDLRAESRRSLDIPSDRPVLTFLAGRAPHNLDALRDLETAVLPLLSEPATVLVVGGRCGTRQPGGRGLRDRHLGYVDDLTGVLAATDVALNPVSGSGSSVKVADYLGAGLPVVSTPTGARGFEQYVHVAKLSDFPTAIAAALRQSSPHRTPPEELSTRRIGSRLRQAYEGVL
jgi:hypothetical protein